MLVGRATETARLQALIDEARRGTSGALIVHGDPGIGKTSLLERSAASASDFLVLRAHPLQAESELPFAGLSDLLAPILHLLERLPERQQAALRDALALGPPAPGDRFAVAAATLTLLAAAGDASPVLAVVDDAHWLDAPSRGALVFTGRRLGSEGVVLLLGMRDRDWLRGVGLDTLQLRGLPAADAEALLEAAGTPVDGAVRRRVITETDGNPLAILEAVSTLSDGQLTGKAPIAHPLAVGAFLERTFVQYLDGLPEGTRRALLVAAASDTGSAREIQLALRELELGMEDLEPAERSGVVSVTPGRIAFRHPLVRSAVYHAHEPAARRAAHRALAGAVGTGDSSAWHLAAAAAGPDEEVASLLEATASGALGRSAYAAAASGFEAAAALSASDAPRLRRTIGAGQALWLGGEPNRAAALLGDVVDLAADPRQRAHVQQLRSAAMVFTRPVAETRAMLVAEAERVEPHDRLIAAQMFANASIVCFMPGELARAEAIARRAVHAAGDDTGPAGLVATLALGTSLAIRGEVSAALELIERAFRPDKVPALVDPTGEFAFVISGVVQAFIWTERWSIARSALETMITTARSAAAVTVLPFLLAVLAELELRAGRTAAAYASAAESVQLAQDTAQAVESSYSLITLARIEALLGHDAECRARVTRALELSRRTGAESIGAYAAAVLGLLELGRGDADRAAWHLAQSAGLQATHGAETPTVIEWSGDLIEARMRSGDLAGAQQSLTWIGERARATGLRWASAIAARGRGLLAAEPDYEEEFAAALDVHGTEMPYERARTELCLGMRRRRSRRRADARVALHRALAYFEIAGCEPWAEQARAELRAAGDPTPALRRGSAAVRSLTPQELQVALVVAGGATNKEAAASLFLSTKTVEFHLSNAYRKLGVRSRAELVRKVEGLS